MLSAAGEGYPDPVLQDPDGDPWRLVGRRLDDACLTDPDRCRELWEEKRKCLTRMARGMILITPRRPWARDPMGKAPAPGLEKPEVGLPFGDGGRPTVSGAGR
jgi:hypothetical protein